MARRTRSLTAFFVTVLVTAGCAAAPMPVETLLEDGKRPVTRAFEGHMGEWLRVRGSVVEVGMRNGLEVRGVGDYVQAGWTHEGKQVPVRFGLVALVGPDPALGRLRCRVDAEDQHQLEGLHEGDTVVVKGLFEKYSEGPDGMVADLNHCDIVR
jgi:hypothetical protein